MLYGFIAQVAPLNGQNFDTFLGHRMGMEYMTRVVGNGVEIELDASWRPRVLSRVLGSAVTGDALSDGTVHPDVFASRVGMWVAGWFLATAVVSFWGAGTFGLWFVIATFCGIMFAIQPGVDPRVYPWDMPALFFFSLATASWMKDRPLWFLPLLPIAVLFKETAIVLAFGYLFVRGGRTRRLTAFGIALALGAGTKVIADLATTSSGALVTTPWLLVYNLQEAWRHPLLLLSNAGFTACAFILMPWSTRTGRALGTIAVVFTGGIMTLAIASEYRIWFELLPLGLFALTSRMTVWDEAEL
jgi:hypothetical protein